MKARRLDTPDILECARPFCICFDAAELGLNLVPIRALTSPFAYHLIELPRSLFSLQLPLRLEQASETIVHFPWDKKIRYARFADLSFPRPGLFSVLRLLT